MIARIWRGWTSKENADAYVEYLERTGIPAYRATPGNLGAFILRRADAERMEFVTLSFWDSLDSIVTFAGEPVDRAVFYPEDDRFLVERETTVAHFELFDSSPELRVALTVDEVERALDFYRDGLGLTLAEAWERPTGSGAILTAGRATLELLSPDEARFVDQVEVGHRTAAPIRLAFEVPDSAASADRLEAAGGERVAEPVVTPWGHRNVRMRAPEGTQLTLFTVPDERG
jgi:lactoylglutathione lyase